MAVWVWCSVIISSCFFYPVLCDKESDFIQTLPGWDGDIPYKQYSGYLDAGQGRWLHYWLVESEARPQHDPLVLWLNGGPGCSSMTGMLEELGPFWVNKDGRTLRRNNYAWNKIANVWYLESPAGVGFSYSESGNVTTDDVTTRDQNYLAIKAFFRKFPEYAGREFYITGESYAGVYIPMLGARVLQDPDINFKGYAIGNGMLHRDLLDSALVYFEYYHGILGNVMWAELLDACCDGNGADRCMFAAEATSKPHCAQLVSAAIDRAWRGGTNVYGMFDTCDGGALLEQVAIQGDPGTLTLPHPGLMSPLFSGQAEILKKLQSAVREGLVVKIADTPCTDSSHVSSWISSKQVQEALHVTRAGVAAHASCSDQVSAAYTKQVFDLTPQIRKALDKGLRILIYNGDTDMACNFLGCEWFVESLQQPLVQPYKAWFSRDQSGAEQVAGYAIQYQQINFVTIKGAGHYVPTDKPQESFEMFERFLKNQPF